MISPSSNSVRLSEPEACDAFRLNPNGCRNCSRPWTESTRQAKRSEKHCIRRRRSRTYTYRCISMMNLTRVVRKEATLTFVMIVLVSNRLERHEMIRVVTFSRRIYPSIPFPDDFELLPAVVNWNSRNYHRWTYGLVHRPHRMRGKILGLRRETWHRDIDSNSIRELEEADERNFS